MDFVFECAVQEFHCKVAIEILKTGGTDIRIVQGQASPCKHSCTLT